MTIPIAYLNGRFLPVTEASLSLRDAGFVMGATVTDFCRTFNHVLFRWHDHLARFRRDCETCFISLEKTDDEQTAIAAELIANNGRLLGPGQELALVTFATPGPIGYYLAEPGGAGDGPPTLGMHTFPFPFARYKRFFEEGVSLHAPVKNLSNPSGFVDPQIKHRSRMMWWILDHAPRERPGSVPILFDAQSGTLLETAIGNLLIVTEGAVVTPWRHTVLDGISLHVVVELCRELNIPVIDGRIPMERCGLADEAMLCGTAFCLAGVSRIDDTAIPWPGSVFKRLLSAWSDRVGVDIARQFLN